MTSIRVSAQGRSFVFPSGATVRIGSAQDSDVVLSSPTVGSHHARLVPDGDAWRLVDDEVTGGIWAGGWVSSLPVTGTVTAQIGNQHGTTEVSFQLISAPSPFLPGNLGQRLAAAKTQRLDQAGEPPPQARPIEADEPPRPRPVQVGEPPPQPRPIAAEQPPQAQPVQAGGPLAAPSPQPPWPQPPSPQPPSPQSLSPQPPSPQPAPPRPTPPPPVYAGGPPPTLPFQAAQPGKPTAVLVTRIGGVQRIFPVGTRVRVGRDPSLELVSLNPLVSRECHGVITSDEGGATYTDQSRRGTFLNGKPLRRPLRITESVLLRLGDPATGEELGITPPLSSSRLARNRGSRIRSSRVRMAALAGAAAVVAGVVAAVLVTTTKAPAPKPKPSATSSTLSGGLQASVLQHAETATVRLLIGSPSNYTGWGSGTLISPTGLILTNAHVAEPQAPGAPVAMGLPSTQLGPNPPYLTVELTTGPASPVVARYRARPVVADGYLDFAVVQIYATVSGQPVNPSSLHLPYFPLGNDSAVQLDQTVTILGFPGVAESDSISVTSGVISTFVPDPLGIVKNDPRFELETTARVAHGNSGGAAINDAGQLIGVPSEEVTGEGGDISWRLRSVAQAIPLINAARNHTSYRSKILVQLTGQEQVGPEGIGVSAQAACSGSRTIPAGPTAMFGVNYAQFPKGLDVALLIAMPGGRAVTGNTGALPEAIVTQSNGCISYELDASQLGLAVLPAGTYEFQLLGGPDLTPLDNPTKLTVGAATAASP